MKNVDWKFDSHQTALSDNRRKFRSMGRNVLHYRLHAHPHSQEGRSVEFDNQWRRDRWNLSSSKRPSCNGGKRPNRGRFTGFNRRCWNIIHTTFRRTVPATITAAGGSLAIEPARSTAGLLLSIKTRFLLDTIRSIVVNYY